MNLGPRITARGFSLVLSMRLLFVTLALLPLVSCGSGSRVCSSSRDCAAGKVCSSSKKICVAGHGDAGITSNCLSDADCAFNQICQGGSCVTGTATGSTGTTGSTGNTGTTGSTGTTGVTGHDAGSTAPKHFCDLCLADSECGPGNKCLDPGTGAKFCSKTCAQSTDCPSGFSCSNLGTTSQCIGTCGADKCAGATCPSGQTCNPNTGTCNGPGTGVDGGGSGGACGASSCPQCYSCDTSSGSPQCVSVPNCTPTGGGGGPGGGGGACQNMGGICMCANPTDCLTCCGSDTTCALICALGGALGGGGGGIGPGFDAGSLGG